jgi:hypothetical protein
MSRDSASVNNNEECSLFRQNHGYQSGTLSGWGHRECQRVERARCLETRDTLLDSIAQIVAQGYCAIGPIEAPVMHSRFAVKMVKHSAGWKERPPRRTIAERKLDPRQWGDLGHILPEQGNGLVTKSMECT